MGSGSFSSLLRRKLSTNAAGCLPFPTVADGQFFSLFLLTARDEGVRMMRVSHPYIIESTPFFPFSFFPGTGEGSLLFVFPRQNAMPRFFLLPPWSASGCIEANSRSESLFSPFPFSFADARRLGSRFAPLLAGAEPS